jgi:hypothetical protein
MSMTSALPTQAPKTLDNWSNLDYKQRFWYLMISPIAIPLWVGEDNQRRLRAYTLLESYYSNSSRVWLEMTTTDIPGDRREYGDSFVLVETAMTSLIGDTQKIVVEGSLSSESPEDPAAVLQAQLDEWAELEKFYMKVIESERQSVKLGDSVYVLGYDPKKKRPRMNVYDPGFYFPVFEEMEGRSAEDFPRKVHIAYEFKKVDERGEETYFVRVITWELIEVETAYTPQYATEATNENVTYFDRIYDVGDMGPDLNFFTGPPKEVLTELTFLNIDFIPVVHIPNTVALQNHFGRSVLAPVLQIIDDIQSTDTDLQASSATTGSPPIVVTGKTGARDTVTYGPGSVFYVGDGDATMIDTSTSLDALLKLEDALLKRLSINSRTPEALLGRVKPNEVPSGIALTLSFTPHISMVNEMRLVRKQKYCLLLKFISRYMGNKDGTEIYLHFGSFLPAEKQEAMTMVVQLLSAKAISLETAIQMLMEAGVPIENWVEEITRIHSQDVGTAIQLMGITGDPNTALDYLGMPKIATVDLGPEDDPNALPPGQ